MTPKQHDYLAKKDQQNVTPKQHDYLKRLHPPKDP